MIKLHQSIITKLILISCLILLVVVGIVTVALFSSNHVEGLLLGGVSQDIEQMLANAAMRRKLGQVFADTNILVSTFSEREEWLRAESERLEAELLLCRNTLAETEQGEHLLAPLEEFIRPLKALLEQAAQINSYSRTIQDIDAEITKQLETIEQTVVWQEAFSMTEKSNASSREKLLRLLPKYQQLLLQITVRIGRMKQAYLSLEVVDVPYEQDILELLRKLGADLVLLKNLGGEKLALQSQGFLNAISGHKALVLNLHQTLQLFQERLRTLKIAEQQLAEEIGERDEQIALSTKQTFIAIADTIRASEHFMLGFSGVILLVLFFLGMYVVRLLQPIKNLAVAANYLAKGDMSYSFQSTPSMDEIGLLSRAFQRLVGYMQEMSQVAMAISEGKLSTEIQARSTDDALGNAFLRMVQYIRYTAEITTNISEGDLSRQLHLRSSADTFGQAIQAMTEGLRSLIMRIRMSAEQIAATGTAIAELSTNDIRIVEDAGTSVKHLNVIMDRMGENVEDVAQNMNMLSSSVELTSDSIAEMTLSIGHIAANSTTLTRQTHQTISAMDDTLQSLDKVVENIDTSQQLSLKTHQDAYEGTQAVEEVMAGMEMIHRTVMTSVEAMTRFSERSQDIHSILEVIRNITEQTTLLALNASIIAAQAGGYGRGFAVVADEMKSLADGVGASTKDIASIVHSLKQDTADVMETIHAGVTNVQQGIEHTRHAREALEQILVSADRSSAVVKGIAETLHTLRRTTREVASDMQEVDRMTADITTATNQQKTSTEQIHLSIGHINTMAAQTQQTTAEQLKGVQQILNETSDVVKLITQSHQSSSQITRTTEELSSQAELLLNAVDRFKLPDR